MERAIWRLKAGVYKSPPTANRSVSRSVVLKNASGGLKNRLLKFVSAFLYNLSATRVLNHQTFKPYCLQSASSPPLKPEPTAENFHSPL